MIRKSYLCSFSFDGVYFHIWKVNNNNVLCEDFEDSLWGSVCEEAQRETSHVFWSLPGFCGGLHKPREMESQF